MSEFKFRVPLICVVGFAALLSAEADDPSGNEHRIAILEARLVELEARLSEVEKRESWDSNHAKTRIAELETRLSEAEQMATENALKNSKVVSDRLKSQVNHGLLWLREERWDEIKPGVSMEVVVELLGQPLRSLDSLKPRVDLVFYYQSGLRVSADSLRGKISFKDDKVLTVEKPDFGQSDTDLN